MCSIRRFIFTRLFSQIEKQAHHFFAATTEIPHHLKWEFFGSFADDIKSHTHRHTHPHTLFARIVIYILSWYKFIQKRVFTSNLPQLIKCDVCSLLIDWIASKYEMASNVNAFQDGFNFIWKLKRIKSNNTYVCVCEWDSCIFIHDNDYGEKTTNMFPTHPK